MFNTFIVTPLYNGLVGIMDVLPFVDVGIAVIIFTIIVRLILFPLSKGALLTQVRMKEVEPEANRIKAQYADDRQTQAVKIMELYRAKKIRPFASILLLFIQFPILLALISVFYKITPTIHPELLYSFIHVPMAKPTLLGLDLLHKNLILAIVTGVIQFFQLHFSLATRQNKATAAVTKQNPSSNDTGAMIAQNMSSQMKYVLPLVAFASVYWLIPARFPQAAAVVAIYWSVSALFTLGQEIYIRKRHLK